MAGRNPNVCFLPPKTKNAATHTLRYGGLFFVEVSSGFEPL